MANETITKQGYWRCDNVPSEKTEVTIGDDVYKVANPERIDACYGKRPGGLYGTHGDGYYDPYAHDGFVRRDYYSKERN